MSTLVRVPALLIHMSRPLPAGGDKNPRRALARPGLPRSRSRRTARQTRHHPSPYVASVCVLIELHAMQPRVRAGTFEQLRMRAHFDNTAFVEHYALNPTQIRRQHATRTDHGVTVKLGYRPPYDVSAMLGFFKKRQIDSLEWVSDDPSEPRMRRTLRVDAGGKTHAGWLSARFDQLRCLVELQVSESLHQVLPLVIRRLRAMLDLDAVPQAINSVLHQSFPGGDGLRVPGAMDGFELAVRAVLGQQITVAAARTLGQRLVDTLGEPMGTPWPELMRLFPSAAVLAQASGETLGRLGIIKQRQVALLGLAKAVAEKRLQLHAGAAVNPTISALKELPGIGDWTAQYIAMRALRWPDAFPAGDMALHQALAVRGLKNPIRQAELASMAWRPWRSYAVIRAWSGALHAAPRRAP